MAAGFEHRTGIAVQRRLAADLPRLSSEQDLVLYRVAQEALTNVARHARAQHVELCMECVEGHVRVVVRDDGCGFTGVPPDDRGIGGIRERAMLVGGSVEVESAAGRGTQVVLSIPVDGR